MEEETQRIVLVGGIDINRVVTGVCVALLGTEDEEGQFVVKEYCTIGMPPQPELPLLKLDWYLRVSWLELFTSRLIDWLIDWLHYLLTHIRFVCRLIDWLLDRSIDRLMDWLIDCASPFQLRCPPFWTQYRPGECIIFFRGGFVHRNVDGTTGLGDAAEQNGQGRCSDHRRQSHYASQTRCRWQRNPKGNPMYFKPADSIFVEFFFTFPTFLNVLKRRSTFFSWWFADTLPFPPRGCRQRRWNAITGHYSRATSGKYEHFFHSSKKSWSSIQKKFKKISKKNFKKNFQKKNKKFFWKKKKKFKKKFEKILEKNRKKILKKILGKKIRKKKKI